MANLKLMETSVEPTVTSIADGATISKGYVSQILSGKRTPTLKMACRIFRMTGAKVGPLANATDDEIAVVERFAA